MAYKYDPNAGGDDSKEFERPTVGQKAARCLMAIEMGTVKNHFPGAANPTKPEIRLVFELGQKMQDGRPFVVSESMTFSFGDGAHMMRHLVPWRGGVKYTEQEKVDFCLSRLVGLPALVQIFESPDKNDPNKIWTNVKQISQLPEEMPVADLINVPCHFTIEEIGTEKWELIYPWIQKMIIEKSEEGQAYLASHPGFEYGKKKSQADEPTPEATPPAEGQQFEADGVTPKCPF
jgi:hypothetical protein